MPNSHPPDEATGPTVGAGFDPQGELEDRLRQATLGDYEILGQLGFGGMAAVYLAHDLALDRRVAIKVMSPAMMYGPGLVERFRLEARTAAALSHPNIIPIYAVRESGGLLFFVMKVVEGTSLDAVIGEVGPLPIPMVEALLAQAGGALGYAHRNGVVHRDVKPANILLDEEGWVVVTDFGIAKVADSSVLTMTGVAVGTPTYMSPEQCAGGEITGASDQYSLGIVAYEMLTGRPPFVDQSIPALMVGHTTKQPPSILSVRPDCTPALLGAVERMLAKDPADRFGTIEEAIVAADARPLSPDDSTRGTLVSLAKNSSTRNILAQVRTPRSPVPLLHRSKSGATGSQSRRNGLMVAGGLAVGVVATAIVAISLNREPAPQQNAVLDSAPAGIGAEAESTGAAISKGLPPVVPPERGSEQGASLEAEKTTSEASTPTIQNEVASPPSPPSTANPLPAAVNSLPEEGRPAITKEVMSPDSAVEQPPEIVVTPPPPPPEAAPVVDQKAEVESVVRSYARALESGQIQQAMELFPNMPSDQREGLQAFYRDGSTMRTAWRFADVVIDGTKASMRIVGTNHITTGRGGSSEQPVALRASLELSPDGWRLTELAN